MSEIENSGFFKALDFEYRNLRKDILDLFCYFEACSNSPSQTHDDLRNLKSEFFFEEVSRLLLSISVLIREIINREEADQDEAEGYNSFCGNLEENTGDETISLSIREACNKIIHAAKINFDDNNSIIYLYGFKFKREWKASIDIKEFCLHCSNLASARSLTEHMSKDQLENRAKFLPFE